MLCRVSPQFFSLMPNISSPKEVELVVLPPTLSCIHMTLCLSEAGSGTDAEKASCL